MSRVIYNYLITGVNSIMIMYLIRTMYEIPYRRKTAIIYTLLGSLVTGSILNAFGGVNNNDKTLAFIAFYILLTCLLFRLKLGYALFGICLFFITAAIGEVLTYFLLIKFWGLQLYQVQASIYLSIFCQVFDYLMILVVIYLINQFRTKKFLTNLNMVSQNVFLIVFLVVVLLLIQFNFFCITKPGITPTQIITINLIATLGLMLFSIVFVFLNQWLIAKKTENEQLKMYIETINELSEELRRFKHNYLNILHGFSGFIENREWDALTEYFNEVINTSQELSKNNVFAMQKIKNYSIFGLLSAKIKYAKALNIDVRLEAAGEVNETMMTDSELCEILGIYLDNAIEAAETAEEKSIVIKIINDTEYLTFNIANTYSKTPDLKQIRQKNYSTKGENRGFGLWIADNIIAKYEGVLANHFLEPPYFRQELILPLPQPKEKRIKTGIN